MDLKPLLERVRLCPEMLDPPHTFSCTAHARFEGPEAAVKTRNRAQMQQTIAWLVFYNLYIREPSQC